MKEKVTAGKIWGVIYPMLLYTAITYLIVILLAVILTVMLMVTGNTSDPEIIANNVMEGINGQMMMLTLCAALATIPFLIYFMHRDIQREKLNNRLKKYENVFFIKYLLIIPFGFFCMLSANYFVSILALFMPDFMTESYTSTAETIYGSGMLVQILAAGIAGPIVEELIFRGLIYKRIKKMSSVMIAGILSSLLFGLYHGNWIQAPYAFIIGMVCVFVYEKYKSIIAPILLHISANMLSVGISYAATKIPAAEETVEIPEIQQLIVYVIITAITGALAFLISLAIKQTVNPKEISE